MLVLGRREGEKILVGDDIVVTLARLGVESARIGIDAPPHVNIRREELAPKADSPKADPTGVVDGIGVLVDLLKTVEERNADLARENARLRRRIMAGAASGATQVIFEYAALSDAIAFAERQKTLDPTIVNPDGTVYFTPRQEAAIGVEIAENERKIGLGTPHGVSAAGLAAQPRIG